MLKQIQASILAQLAPVRDLLRPDRNLRQGLPYDVSRMTQEDAGNVVVFIKGGNIREVQIEINVLLPSRIKSSTACFPVVEQVWGLLHLFRPENAAGVLANMSWELIAQDKRWLAKFNYTVAISPYVFEFPDPDHKLPSIEEIAVAPIAPSFSISTISDPL
jgi:hypothetical protein